MVRSLGSCPRDAGSNPDAYIEFSKSYKIKMVKQRENYKFIILEPALTWMNESKCMGCGKPKDQWTRTTKHKCCSVACTTHMHSNYQYFGWPDLRKKVLKRDNYKCVLCNHTPTHEVYNSKDWNDIVLDEYKREGIQIYLCIDTAKLTADHIHAIALGGDEWDINNIQTLCSKCNKIKTKNDMALIARLRLSESLERIGQSVLSVVDQPQASTSTTILLETSKQ